jgi:hypothetical protein
VIRAGSSSATALAFVILFTVIGAALTQAHVQRLRELGARQQRISARELALGAAALPLGGRLDFDGWTVERAADGTRTATGPAGTYAIDDRGERWRAAGGARTGAAR